MADETDRTAAVEPEDKTVEQSRSVPLWLVVSAVIVLGAVVGVIIYGYLERPGWIGVADKKVWDYLELLIVPAALALGVAWLNWAKERERQAQVEQRDRERELEAEQREREREADAAQREREREDAWAAAHPFEVEQEKPEEERGLYLEPSLYDAPEDLSVIAARK